MVTSGATRPWRAHSVVRSGSLDDQRCRLLREARGQAPETPLPRPS
jgi:hypothetical protein